MHDPLRTIDGFVPRLHAAIALLWEATVLANDSGQDVWQFAVEVHDLLAAGLSKNTVRWLVHKDLALCAVELSSKGAKGQRRFRRAAQTPFPGKACLVLTAEGVRLAGQLQRMASPVDLPAPTPSVATKAAPARVPAWDATARVLTWGGVVVKQFKVPAANQEKVLSAFQEEGWPASIYDPLPPVPGIDAKRRLHDTINRLNRNQRERRLRFYGNGNGQAIRWAAMS